MADYDVVVIGSGANGLISGAYMAKAGHKVIALERNEWFGGGAVTREFVAPGFLHDMHSATHILIQANPLIIKDELELQSKFGLKYIYPEGIFSTIFDDQTSMITYASLDKTCESIAQHSPRDAEAYRKFTEAGLATLPMIVQSMFIPPAPAGPFFALMDQSRQGRELMRIMQSSMLDIVNEWFESDKLKVHLLKFACETLVGPAENGTGMVLFMLPGLVHSYPSGVPVGGSGALPKALAKCIEHHGGEVRTSAKVEKVIVEGGRAVGVRLVGGEVIRAKTAVIGQIHPHLLGDMVDGLDENLVKNAKRTKSSTFVIMSQHFALNEPPKYYAGDAAAHVALANFAPASLEEYCRVFNEFDYGNLSNKQIIASHCNSQWDPTRAPPGKANLTLFGFGPFDLRGGWDARKEEAADVLRKGYQHYMSNLTSDNIIAEAFETPMDHMRYSPTFQRGDVGGVGKYLYQIGGHRPTPELSQYAVPGVERLYLAGTFMHPPGGITGGGRATAIKMFRDLKIDFDKVVAKK